MKTLKILAFIFGSLFFSFCSGNSDKELFEQAQKLIDEQKYDEAVVIFEKVVTENNKSEIAPKALFECAKIYQGQVIKDMNAEKSLRKAVEFYKRISDDYPQTKEAENSLFMAGFILANELRDYRNAKVMYESYIQKFPNGELADDARVELENLGKSPEEILKEKVQEDTLNEKTI
jgi:outer membrane protein assembly factor BamD (BamD/ComL family)